MTSRLPGIAGTLFPEQFLAEHLAPSVTERDLEPLRTRLRRWWHLVESACGPASGMRLLFDRMAMPLFGSLGYSAKAVTFRPHECRCLLETPAGVPLVLLLLPWAERPSGRWRDVAASARDIGAAWAFVVAGPYLSLVEVRGFATRRSLDLLLPAAIESHGLSVLYATCRAAAFHAGREGTVPPLTRWLALAAAFESSVRDDLRFGVSQALSALTAAVRSTRPATRTDSLSAGAHGQALTLVYRILFLLFAESRGLVPDADRQGTTAYEVGTLCREAWPACRATASGKRWRRSRACRAPAAATSSSRRSTEGFSPDSLRRRSSRRRLPGGHRGEVPVRDQLAGTALAALGSRPGPAGRQRISYRDLGVDQLGAVYEHLLDQPRRQTEDAASRPSPGTHSAARKETGTFYTPRALAEFVVRRTLGPLVRNAPSDRILALRVVDPAMGSGAFLVAACHYLARAYGHALVAEGQCSAEDLDAQERAHHRRLIAERCLAGVDSNPVAVQLARLSLWLTTLARGKPLGFLDHRLRTGDSLVGVRPDDLARLRRPPGARRPAPVPLFDDPAFEDAVRRQAAPLRALVERPEMTPGDVDAKARLWKQLSAPGAPLGPWRRAATLWCARWFWPATATPAPDEAELRALIDAVLGGDPTLPDRHLTARLEAAEAAAAENGFFHWPIEFADVFSPDDGRAAGFDAVIGNPPWEMLRRDPSGGADDRRRRLLRFVRDSGAYSACGHGHLNLYQPFTERTLSLVRPGGRIGLVLPWGLAVDDGSEALRRRLVAETSIDTLVGLDNSRGLFPVHRGLRFVALVAGAGKETQIMRSQMGISSTEALDQLPGGDEAAGGIPDLLPLRLAPRDLSLVGGSTLRVPFARDPIDLAVLRHLFQTAPRLGAASSWSARFGRELNATESRPACGPRGLPVIDGRHVSPFVVDTRTRRRMTRSAAQAHLPDGRFDHPRLGYRDVSGHGNLRTLIAAVIPAGVLTTHTISCLRTPVTTEQAHYLCGLFNSLVLNAVVRLLMGSHVTTGLVEDLPVPRWTGDGRSRSIALVSEELSRTPGDERAQATLEALVARQYGLDAPQFAHILAGFPRVSPTVRDQAARLHQREEA